MGIISPFSFGDWVGEARGSEAMNAARCPSRPHTHERRRDGDLTNRNKTLARQPHDRHHTSTQRRPHTMPNMRTIPYLGHTRPTSKPRSRPHHTPFQGRKRLNRQHPNHLPRLQPQQRKRAQTKTTQTNTTTQTHKTNNPMGMARLNTGPQPRGAYPHPRQRRPPGGIATSLPTVFSNYPPRRL